MKQSHLLPSGVQTWHSNVLGSGGQHFVYASTLATYTHAQSDDYRLHRLQTAHERTLTGLSWNPSSATQYATAGADMRVVRWSVQEEKEIAAVTLANIPVMIDWAGHTSGLEDPIAVLLKTGSIGLWDGSSAKLRTVDALKESSHTTLRWNYAGKAPQLAVGKADGTLLIYDRSRDKIVQKIEPPQLEKEKSGEIIDIQWDPLSNQFLLVLYRSGFIALVDSESGQLLQRFNRPSHDPSMLAFVPNSPGDFLSINAASATLTLWNVSQTKSKEIIKVDAGGAKRCGLLSVKLMNSSAPPAPAPVVVAAAPASSSSSSAAAQAAAAAAAAAAQAAANQPALVTSAGSPKFILAFLDGSVGVFDFTTRHMDFLTTPAHSETIFDVRFKPSSSDVLATASYDSTVKIWNVSGMTQLQELKGQAGVLYAVSWAPGDESEQRLASSGSEGDVFIWDAKSGQALTRSKHHSKPVYGLKWHPTDKELIASASSDGYVVTFNPAGKVLKKFKHPAAAYGVDWSPFHKAMLATGCHDGIVRVFDCSKDSSKPIHELEGHTARSFNAVWSPLLPDRLASGSDDKTIRVWDLSPHGNGKVTVLTGHTHNVRALTWSQEVPFLLLSGSWDGTIRIWDIRTAKCLHVIEDHHSDVYGLAVHPSRPFSFVSSSRDTSLRFWNMDDTLVAEMKIQSILADGLLQPSHLEEIHVAMKPSTSIKLCGSASLAMVGKAVRELKDLDRYAKLFDFFTNTRGMKELWALLEAIVNNKPTTNDGNLLHINDVRPVAIAQARALNASKNSALVGVGKRSDRLSAAANAYLALGAVREYCEIQVELGAWEKALSFAPAASMSYWKLLLVRYGFHLREQGDQSGASQAFLASGETKLLLAQQLRAKDIQGAFISAVSEAVGALPFLPPFDAEEDKKFQALLAAQGNSHSSHAPSFALEEKNVDREPVPLSDGVRQVAEAQSSQYFQAASPVMAACALLRVGDAIGAVQKLVLGNELLLALAVCRVLRLQHCDDVFLASALLCEELGLHDDAFKCLLQMRNPTDEIILLAARFVGPANKKQEFYLKVGIRSQEAFAQSAEQALKDHKNIEALTGLVASGQFEHALVTGMDMLRDFLNQNAWGVEDLSNLIKPLNSVNLLAVSSETRTQFLIYSYFVGAHVAMNHGYSSVVSFLFDSIHSLVSKLQSSGTAVSFPLPAGVCRLQEATYFQSIDPARALALVKEVLAESGSSLNAKYKAGANTVKKAIETSAAAGYGLTKKFVSKNTIVPTASNLPCGGTSSKTLVSLISHAVIEGPRLNVDQPPNPQPVPGLPEGAQNPNANYVTLAEALMLVKCTPFSPNHSGQRLKVFALL